MIYNIVRFIDGKGDARYYVYNEYNEIAFREKFAEDYLPGFKYTSIGAAGLRLCKMFLAELPFGTNCDVEQYNRPIETKEIIKTVEIL